MDRVGAVAEKPHKWTSKYGSLVVTGYDIGTHDGVNEKGLGYQYVTRGQEEPGRNLPS